MATSPSDDVYSLRLGFHEVDEGFGGLKLGEFCLIHGGMANFISLLLSFRAQLPIDEGGLNSPALFVDGGNSFNPYLVAELARSYGVDARAALENIYVSRAFTAYQLSSLILKELGRFQEQVKAKAVIVSDVASLYLDRDLAKGDVEDMFGMVCGKLLEVARRGAVVVATYRAGRRCRRGLLLEALLFGYVNTVLRFDSSGSLVRFRLERHPKLSPFALDFSLVYPTLMDYVEGGGFG